MVSKTPKRFEPANPFARTLAALRRWPDARQWLQVAPVLAATAGLVLAIAMVGGFAHWAPLPFGAEWLRIAAIALVLPALVEEIVFRGLLMPVPGIASMRIGMWLSIALFVAWHPLQAIGFGPPWSALFLAPAFLAAVLVLAVGLTHVRIVTGSLWPAILGHWATVAAWKLLFAGPF
jgi:predicted Abi (CAAX) family protease